MGQHHYSHLFYVQDQGTSPMSPGDRSVWQPVHARHLRTLQLWCLLFLSSLLLWGCQPRPMATRLNIATAANMQFAIAPLTQAFTQQTGIPCTTIISSSGKLTAQIQAGAPFDVFVSADMQYPTRLFEQGLTLTPPQVYATGKLILWSYKPGIELSMTALTQERVKHIALANPKIAPYGEAAIATLKHYQLYNQVQDKLVFGENIAQTNQFITSHAAEMGFTAQSVVFSAALQEPGQWQEVNAVAYPPIEQGIVLLKRNPPKRKHHTSTQSTQGILQKQAQQFYEFLFSETGQQILSRYGYGMVERES